MNQTGSHNSFKHKNANSKSKNIAQRSIYNKLVHWFILNLFLLYFRYKTVRLIITSRNIMVLVKLAKGIEQRSLQSLEKPDSMIASSSFVNQKLAVLTLWFLISYWRPSLWETTHLGVLKTLGGNSLWVIKNSGRPVFLNLEQFLDIKYCF